MQGGCVRGVCVPGTASVVCRAYANHVACADHAIPAYSLQGGHKGGLTAMSIQYDWLWGRAVWGREGRCHTHTHTARMTHSSHGTHRPRGRLSFLPPYHSCLLPLRTQLRANPQPPPPPAPPAAATTVFYCNTPQLSAPRLAPKRRRSELKKSRASLRTRASLFWFSTASL